MLSNSNLQNFPPSPTFLVSPQLTPDRVFVKAITTIRALSSRSNHGSLPRPPAENRIKLYGLYKQATEGNVQGIMARPEGHTLEDEGAKKKWDAWKREEGLSRTEAKRQYISYLIDTMKVYASGTSEARELLSELEYLWDQIKDVEFSDDEPRHVFYNVAPLVISNVDQLDRYSTATPWPLQSNYLALATNHQYRNNLEQIYLHLRRNTQLLLAEYVKGQGQSQSQGQNYRGASKLGALLVPLVASRQVDVPAGTLEDFRAWQGEINLIINKISKEYATRKLGTKLGAGHGLVNPFSVVETDLDGLEGEIDPREATKRKIVFLLRTLGKHVLHFLKSFLISTVAILFVVWCFKKNVVVQRTVVKSPVGTRQKKELVINMVVPDENKWFIRLLLLVNSLVGFV